MPLLCYPPTHPSTKQETTFSVVMEEDSEQKEHALGLAVPFEPGIICNFSFQAGTLDFLTEN